MAFHEDAIFPERISYGAVGGPKFKTTILQLSSGFEQRNIDWANSRAEYDVAYGLKTQTEIEEIRAFFMARYGRAHGFRYKDWFDYTLTRQAIGTTDGTTANWQIYKRYGSGSEYHDRDIKKPVLSTINVWVGGTQKVTAGVGSTGVAVDATTGIITLSGTWLTTASRLIEVECEFHVPCRFDTDHIAPTLVDHNLYQWSQIPLVEIRPR